MTINTKKMNAFIEKFENEILPKIKGEDGEGIERLKKMIQKRKRGLAERQKP